MIKAHSIYFLLASLHPMLKKNEDKIAIIGGGIASSSLCLALAQHKQNITLFCQDDRFALQASGNRQGALYPLLIPNQTTLNQFYLQCFLYSRQQIASLIKQQPLAHAFCGVLQTPHNEKSTAKINQLATDSWPDSIIKYVTPAEANAIAGIKIDKYGLFYALGAWVSPRDYTKAMLSRAQELTKLDLHLNCSINQLIESNQQWYLQSPQQSFGPFNRVILANGSNITQFEQTKDLPLTPFRGQVSHIPTSTELSKCKTVLCSEGYFTPAHHEFHCLGASYLRNETHLDYSDSEQNENKNRLIRSYPHSAWVKEVDINNHQAKVGIRMVSRDHFPFTGRVPNTKKLFTLAKQHSNNAAFWQEQTAPYYPNLYMLGGLGSRGICSAPLVAEHLASQLCHYNSPFKADIIEKLQPERMWLRKLRAGKQI